MNGGKADCIAFACTNAPSVGFAAISPSGRNLTSEPRLNQSPTGVADEKGFGQIFGAEVSLNRAAIGDEFAAEDAGEQPARQRRGEQCAGAAHEDVGEAALSNEAIGIDKRDLKTARRRARFDVKAAIGGFVAQTEVAGVNGEPRKADRNHVRWNRLMRLNFNSNTSTWTKHQPHPARLCDAERRRLKLVTRGMAIKRKANQLGALANSRDMAVKQLNADTRVKPHRFKQIKAGY